MKKLNSLLWFVVVAVVVLLWTAVPVVGQDIALPPELLDKKVSDWQLNGVTILLIVQVLGRAFASVSNGGGLVGIFRGIVFGTNTPKQPQPEK